MLLSVGDRLGPYEVLSPLGAGGMGEVYKARDTRLDRLVAIKVAKENFSDRFLREAKAIAALNHPHICILYDVGPNYLVMEYVEGQCLSGPLPFDKVVEYGTQIASALAAAHAKNIIHRDLKPANILITSSGVKLLDFGLAKITSALSDDDATVEGLTQNGAVVGTVAYMSPEQAEGRPIDPRSDIFSFGVLLYEALTGQRAFRGKTAVEILTSLIRNEPTPMRQFRPDSPSGLERIIARCMQRQPTDRFANSGELHSSLRAVQLIDPAPADTNPSLAVLPFANLSADPENEYFSDGLAEEIINTLVQNPGLKVIARTSAFAFKGQNVDVRHIAEKLGVGHILEGSVRKSGNRIRVTAQLITARDGSHLWSQRYDRNLEDIFAVQDEVAQSIAGALQGKLAAGQAHKQKYTPNLQAYEEVLKAWHYQWKFTPEAIDRGRRCYVKAIELDPNFALAYSGYAHSFLHYAVFGLLSPHEAMTEMRRLATKALELDPSLAEAHGLLGIAASIYDYDWREAERRFGLAFGCDPVPPLVRAWPGFFLLQRIGRAREAIADQERAIREDPLNYVLRFALGTSLMTEKDFAEADAQFLQSIELAEGSFFPRFCLSLSLAAQERMAEALDRAETAYAHAPWSPWVMGTLAGLAACNGDTARSEQLLAGIGDKATHDVPLGMTVAHILRRDFQEAEVWASRGIDARLGFLPMVLQFPFAEAFRRSSHWPALARKMNLGQLGQ